MPGDLLTLFSKQLPIAMPCKVIGLCFEWLHLECCRFSWVWTLLVSTYLFVRCNNHKCVQHLCEEVTMTWLLLDCPIWCFGIHLNLLVAHFGTSALLVLLIWKFLTPPTLTFISFITHSHPPYHIHTYYIKSLTKATPSILPTRIDSCPPLIIGMEGHLISIPICHSGTCSHKGLPFDRRPNFSSLDSWRESCHREKTPTLSDGGHEPKNPTHILVREKKCALLACLWLSLPSYDTCSDFFRSNSTYPCHARWFPR